MMDFLTDLQQAIGSNAELGYGLSALGITLFLVAIITMGSSARKAQTSAIEASKSARFEMIVEHATAAMWMASADGSRLLLANGACDILFGCAMEHLYADPVKLQSLIHPDDLSRLIHTLTARHVEGRYEVNYRILRADGQQRYIRETGKEVYDAQDAQKYLICSAIDISGEIFIRDELQGLNNLLLDANLRLHENARRDNLTQCLNRSAFLDEAEKALQLAQRYGRSSTLIFFDLNDFKQLNDNFGHHIGDRGLIEFTEQIKARLRITDELGRYGGDEFVALLRETDYEQAEQLLATLMPVIIDAENGNSIILRYSAGIACTDEVGIESVDGWLRLADSQMYNQKIQRKTVGL